MIKKDVVGEDALEEGRVSGQMSNILQDNRDGPW